MTDGETQTICGFGVWNGSMCLTFSSAPGKYCPEHVDAVCVGCGKAATQECPHVVGVQHCARPICDNCEHRIAEGHGPKITVRDAAYEELAAALRISLEDAAAKGMCAIGDGKVDLLATKLLNDFSMHVTMKILSGIASPPQ